MKKITLFILLAAMLLSLYACGAPKAEEAPAIAEAALSEYSGTYSGLGLYADGHYLTDDYFAAMTTTLDADGTGSLDWGEDNSGPISEWSVTDGALLIKAGVSEIEGSFTDGVMLLDMGDDYIVAFVPEGYDISRLSTAALEDYMNYSAGLSEEETGDSEEAETETESAEAEPGEDTESEAAEAPVVSDAVAELEASYNGLAEDALTWSYDEATRTITVSGEGPMRDYLTEYPDWYQYCDTAEHVVIEDGVASVGPGAFMYFWELSDVSLGASVEYIGESAFDYCWELRTVNFPAGLKYIGERGFYNTLLHSDSGFIFPEGLLYLGDDSFHSAFKESFVSLPASLTYIGETALSNGMVEEIRVSADNPAYTAENGILYDKSMTTLIYYPSAKTDTVYEIPETVTTVSEEAIQVTNTLEKIVIPAGVTYIDEGAVYWNYALSSIEVAEGNQSYKSVDGVLFTADGKTLLCYPIAASAAEYTIPDGCERIGKLALSQATNLTALYIPESLKEIGLWGLYGCAGISQLELPAGMTKIETQAFDCCDSLREIHYAGSSDDWESVEIDEDNEPLFDGSITVTFAE